MSAKVSVIIPCYNAAQYVSETLASLRRQTWPDLEVIVVDDGSRDDSARQNSIAGQNVHHGDSDTRTRYSAERQSRHMSRVHIAAE